MIETKAWLYVLILFLMNCARSQSQDLEIFQAIETHYDVCLNNPEVTDSNLSLSSLIPAINQVDSLGIKEALKRFIPNSEYEYTIKQLEILNHTYWKPVERSCDLQSSNSSISRPLYLAENSKALVIGYRVSGDRKQSILLLEKNENKAWLIKKVLDCGIYFEIGD